MQLECDRYYKENRQTFIRYFDEIKNGEDDGSEWSEEMVLKCKLSVTIKNQNKAKTIHG